MEPIKFIVYGQPQPAGSKSSFVPIDKRTGQPFRSKTTGRVVVNTVDANSKSKDWKTLVAFTAQQHRPAELLDGPIRLTLKFYRQRPSGHFRTNGTLKPEGLRHPFPATKPDVLKLARAVEDALTKVIWTDDARIVDERISKHWCEYGAHVEIEIEPLQEAA